MAQNEKSPAARESGEGDALDALRRRIDEIDRALLERLNQRAALVRQVGEIKRDTGTAVYEPSRERRIVEALARDNPGPFPAEGLAPVFREIISATRSLEERLRVAYLGPAGTFSHQAARARFGALSDLVAVPTIPDVFASVESGRTHLGIVPVENTTEGVVTQTLDTLAEREVSICAESVLPVSISLLSQSGALEDVKRVASHPQPLAQCRRWLEANLPDTERVDAASTAAAAQRAAREPETAALGAEVAAEVYDLQVVAAGVEDRRDNCTRFAVIGGDAPAPSGCDLTSVVFTIRRDQAGGLFRLIEPMARESVNLTSIQLRPIRGKPWEYYFFIDCEGHRSDEPVQRALAAAAEIALSTRVLGSFPRAEAGRAQ